MLFPEEEVAFPLESSTPQGLHEVNGKSDFFRTWFRVPKHRAYLIDYKGSSTSVDLNSLLRIIIPSCPLVVGFILDLDVVSPYLLKFRCCRPKLREPCLPEHRVSCWILLCPLSCPGMSEMDLQVPEKKIKSRKVGFFMVVLRSWNIQHLFHFNWVFILAFLPFQSTGNWSL